MLKFYGQEVDTCGRYWIVFIQKPVYAHCVAINEKILNEAIKAQKILVVQTPGAEEVITPQEWKKKGLRFEKVFMIPDKPMVLWQKNIPPVDQLSPREMFQFS